MNDEAESADAATRSHPGPNSGSGRLEVRCPNCHAPTEVAADTTLTDLTCSACGSHFSLVGQSNATRMAPSLTQLGRFELIERLGVGGFGSVWKARDKELDRTVAIKIPRAGGMTAQEQEKFFREARAAAQLRHPSIVSVHEVGRDGDSVYIVSDFVRGVTLGDWLTGQKLTNREAAELCAKIADALHHAHEQGIVHRDLKPANIMIDGDGEPHLMDFGLARRDVGEVTVTMDGHVLGTPAYMSPEQAEGKAHTADRRSDIYSLGVILFQLLTGELPFRGNARMLMHQVIHDEPPSPRKLNGNIPNDLETITLKCLEKDAAKRYQSADDLAVELRRFLRGDEILARPAGRAERTLRWVRRNRLVAGLIAAIGTLLIAIAIGGTAAAIWFERIARISDEAKQDALLARNTALDAKEREIASRLLAEESARTNRLNLYAARIYSAQQVWENGDLERAKQLLNSLRPQTGQEDLRGFEWYYLWRLCHSEMMSLRGHTGPVRAMAFSPDGTTFASAGDDGILKLCDRINGRELFSFSTTNHSPIRCIAFAPNGKVLAAGTAANTITLWDATTGATLGVLSDHIEPVGCLAFSPDGTILAAGTASFAKTGADPIYRFLPPGSEGQLILWDVQTRTKLRELEKQKAGILSLAFRPDGESLVSAAADGMLKVWSVATGEVSYALPKTGGERYILCTALSRDGATLAVGAVERSLGGAEIKLWDVNARQELVAWREIAAAPLSMAFSADGHSLITGNYDQTATVWDLTSKRQRANIKGHATYVFAVADSSDGQTLATGSADGSVKFWNPAERQEYHTLKPMTKLTNMGGYSVAFAPSSKVLVSSGAGAVRLWDVPAGRELTALEGYSHLHSGITAAFDPSGEILITGDGGGTLRLWNIKSHQLLRTWRPHTGQLRALAFTPDGRQFVSAARGEETVKFWDVTTHHERATLNHRGNVRSLAFSPDGRLLATASRNGAERSIVNIWDVPTARVQMTLPAEDLGVSWVAWSRDGKTLAMGDGDRAVQFWNASTWQKLTRFKAHTNVVIQAAFSPDSLTLATASWDGTVKLWHVATGQELVTLKGPADAFWSVAFSNDGKILAAGGDADDDALHEGVALWRAAPTDSEAIGENPALANENESKQPASTDAITPSYIPGLRPTSTTPPNVLTDWVNKASQPDFEESLLPIDAIVLGELRLVMGKTTEAEKAIRSAMLRGEDRLFAFKSLGWCLIAQGRIDEGRAALHHVINDYLYDDGSLNFDRTGPDELTAAYFLDLISEDQYMKRLAGDDKLACLPSFYIAQRREIERNPEAAIVAYEHCLADGKEGTAHSVYAIARWRLSQLRQAMSRQNVGRAEETQ